jgi:predicted transcriptional regulator of viral defense system
MWMERIKKTYQSDVPIFTDDLLSLYPDFTKAYVFRMLREAEEKGEIIRFSRGVYYLPKETVLGVSKITARMVAQNKYVESERGVYGLYSGLSLLNRFALSTQIPNVLEIVTNHEPTRKRKVSIKGMQFVLRRSRFPINKENVGCYTLLELFSEMGDAPSIEGVSKALIKAYMKENHVSPDQLLRFAGDFPRRALKNLVSSGVLDGTI